MKGRKASRQELVRFHQIRLQQELEHEKWCKRSLARTRDHINHHKEALRRLTENPLWRHGDE